MHVSIFNHGYGVLSCYCQIQQDTLLGQLSTQVLSWLEFQLESTQFWPEVRKAYIEKMKQFIQQQLDSFVGRNFIKKTCPAQRVIRRKPNIWMLFFDKSKESAGFLIILRQFLVIFSTPTFISSQNWRSDGHFEVLNRSKSQLVQKLWHKMQRRAKRVGPYCRSQFWTLFLLLSGPALGSSKIWTLVPDWSRFKSLEANAGHVTRKIGLLYFKLHNRIDIIWVCLLNYYDFNSAIYDVWSCTFIHLQHVGHR